MLAFRSVQQSNHCAREEFLYELKVRTLKAVSVHQFGLPHAAQVLQVARKTRDLHDHPRRCTTVTVYAHH